MFQTSPGINVSEIDLTASAKTVSVSDAAFVGPFQWGPVLEIRNIDSEDALVKLFGKPDSTIASHWFSAAAFLAYSNLLRAVRVVGSSALNATSSAKTLTGTVTATGANATFIGTGLDTTQIVVGQTLLIGAADYVVATIINATSFTTTANTSGTVTANTVGAYAVLIQNETHYSDTFATGITGYGPFAAKYAGELGNGLRIATCASNTAFSSFPTGTITLTSGNSVVSGSGTAFATDFVSGDKLIVGGITYVANVVTNATSMTLTSAASATATATAGSWQRKWEFASLFDRAPGTSAYASDRSGSADELHVVVVDDLGKFSGVPGTVLERFPFLSKASDAKNANGESNYYATVLNRQSAYIWWLTTIGTLVTGWGSPAAAQAFGADATPKEVELGGGLSGNAAVSDGDLEEGFDLFANKDEVDISLVITGPASATLASYVIQNICELRGDCVAYVSPTRAACVNNAGSEVADITTFRNLLPSSSYAFCDGGWKYLYDKYNDTFRWVPLNGDIAGIAARSDSDTDPWYSPAGFNRGNVKNVVKLAWNPKQLDRDDLYKIGVNPVVSFPSQGVVLYGDKTLLDRPSAFDRINVRRLFIIIEKTIARLSRAQLFEFNDELTRSQFRSIVEPFLRDVKARRGVIDFRVICDDSNNPPEVVEQNRFVGDIFVKPSRSINFIQLNFIAVRSGVSFQEVTGAL